MKWSLSAVLGLGPLFAVRAQTSGIAVGVDGGVPGFQDLTRTALTPIGGISDHLPRFESNSPAAIGSATNAVNSLNASVASGISAIGTQGSMITSHDAFILSMLSR